MIDSKERNIAVLLNVSGLFFPLFGPLVLWLLFKEESKFIDQHGKDALNFHISMYIYSFIIVLLCFIFIGFLLIPVLAVFVVLFPILGAVKASNGELYKYPLCFDFIK